VIYNTKNKTTNTKKVIKTTFSVGGLLFAISMIFLFFLNGVNQAVMIGSVGIVMIAHGVYMMCTYREIILPKLIASYNIAVSAVFILWGIFYIIMGYGIGSILWFVMAIVAMIGAIVSNKQTK